MPNIEISFFEGPAIVLLLPILTLFFEVWAVRQKIVSRQKSFGLSMIFFPSPPLFRELVASFWKVSAAALFAAYFFSPTQTVSVPRTFDEDIAVDIVADVSSSTVKTEEVRYGEGGRLGATRRSIINLVAPFLSSDKVGPKFGLVIFAGSVIPLADINTEYDHLLDQVDNIESYYFLGQGTNFEDALRVSCQRLASVPASVKRLILYSDGEEEEGNNTDWQSGVEDCKASGIAIYSIVVGVDEVPLLSGGSYFKDEEDKIVTTKPDPTILREMAEETGGVSTVFEDEKKIVSYFDKLLLSSRKLTERRVKEERDVGWWFLAASIAAMIFRWVTPSFNFSKMKIIRRVN